MFLVADNYTVRVFIILKEADLLISVVEGKTIQERIKVDLLDDVVGIFSIVGHHHLPYQLTFYS